MKKSSNTDALIIGLALFAMFFGAGNLIFPPFIGMQSGNMWRMGFLVFFIFDIGLAFLTIISMINGKIEEVTGVIGKLPALILTTAMMICIGPLVAIPRTAALTFQMLFQKILPFSIPEGTTTAFLLMAGCSIVYFVITYIFTIKPRKVVDIIGTFLTPVMVVLLFVMIIIGVIHPIGNIPIFENTSHVVSLGVQNGYQTMDVLGGLCMAIIICTAVTNRGYTKKKSRRNIALKATVIAGLLLFLIYGGLAYLGGMYASIDNPLQYSVPTDVIVTNIANVLLGGYGGLILGIIVGFACLTTAIGLTSATSMFFEEASKGKIKYSTSVLVICIVSTVLSCLGLETILKFAGPILSILYPVIIVLIVLSFFRHQIKNKNIYKGATLAALIISILTIGNMEGLPFAFIEQLPGYDFQLNWILPAIVGGLIGYFLPPKIEHKK